jgi:hypothetical protein
LTSSATRRHQQAIAVLPPHSLRPSGLVRTQPKTRGRGARCARCDPTRGRLPPAPPARAATAAPLRTPTRRVRAASHRASGGQSSPAPAAGRRSVFATGRPRCHRGRRTLPAQMPRKNKTPFAVSRRPVVGRRASAATSSAPPRFSPAPSTGAADVHTSACLTVVVRRRRSANAASDAALSQKLELKKSSRNLLYIFGWKPSSSASIDFASLIRSIPSPRAPPGKRLTTGPTPLTPGC